MGSLRTLQHIAKRPPKVPKIKPAAGVEEENEKIRRQKEQLIALHDRYNKSLELARRKKKEDLRESFVFFCLIVMLVTACLTESFGSLIWWSSGITAISATVLLLILNKSYRDWCRSEEDCLKLMAEIKQILRVLGT